MTIDTLGDHMKELERVEAGRVLTYPICIRLDGRSFSTFTRGLRRPYDERLSMLMVDLTKALVDETNASLGYTQSDEISLVLTAPSDPTTQGYFGLRTQKIVSMTAAFATSWFTRHLVDRIPERAGRAPLFDSRAWSVPTLTEAAATILWRELDARKNAITMAASHYFSVAEIHGKTGAEKIAMLYADGTDFEAYPSFFRRGTFITRVAVSKPFTVEEIESLPPKHQARTNPNLMVTRHVLKELDLPPLAQVTNRVDVLFHGASPEIAP